MTFKDVNPKENFPELERQILKFWRETDALNKLRQLRAGGPTWSFTDGPITANNPMGVHHAWGRTYKDLFQRYRAMRGFDQRWQNGFDCQGLHVEVNVEKDLGFKNKKDIEAYGIAPFVLLCKQRVLKYAGVQTEQSIRLGMWMDWNDTDELRMLHDKLGENPNQVVTLKRGKTRVKGTVEQLIGQLGLAPLNGSYFTFSDKNNYDIWHFLKKCADEGWIYKGTDVMPWCTRCGTGLSEHEISTEDYPDITHTSVTARLPLKDRPNEYLLVWTTQPWTFIPNVMVSVGPDLTYLKVKQGDATYYISERTTRMLKGPYQVLARLAGREMEGWEYVGAFDELPAEQTVGGFVPPELRAHVPHPPLSAVQAHHVVLWKDVNEEEGTGLVEMGTGAGPEDFRLGNELGLPIVAPLTEDGIFIDGFGEFSGKSVFEVTPRVIEAMREKGMIYSVEPYTHRYPTCWRCKTELVFRLVDEWFIAMNGLREPLMQIAEQIRWIPEFGKERELDWLRNMHDWMISKKRYWGLALPIYECHNCGHVTVVGSREELQERALEGWDEFEGHTPHRPYIDAVKIACANCGEKTSRIKDVGNPWLDAGIVSFSTLGYGDDMKRWRKWFPADFITESFPGQFRNWFYSLLTMAGALENKPATRTILGYGTLLAEDGRAMHKSLGNMIEFNEAADRVGADVMRWMFANQRYEANMLFGYHGADETRRHFLLPLWNVYSFFVTYANLDRWKPKTRVAASKSDLDKWILARLHQLVAQVTDALDAFYAYKAAKPIEEFLDDLSNWYVRRSRRRFWKSETDADKEAAYATLYEVLVTLTKLLAPFVPFVSEAMYQNLVRSVDKRAPLSVHHCDWSRTDKKKVAQKLIDEMSAARTVVALGHALRSEKNLKVRQPLARVVVVAPSKRKELERMAALVTDELNVKQLEFAAQDAELVTYKLLPDNRALGPKYGARFPKIRAALEAVDTQSAVTTLRAGKNLALTVEDQALALLPNEVLVMMQPREGFAVKAEGDVVVALDTNVTPELYNEGLAREFVRHVQTLRKDAGLDISDRIITRYANDASTPKLAAMLAQFGAHVQRETLTSALEAGELDDEFKSAELDLDGERVNVGVKKSSVQIKPRRGKSSARKKATRKAATKK